MKSVFRIMAAATVLSFGAASGAVAHTQAPSNLGAAQKPTIKSPAKPASVPVAAPRVPVVHAPKAPNAKKVTTRKTTTKSAQKPEVDTKAGAAAAAAAAAKPATPAEPPPPSQDPNKGTVTGLPIPRFVALRFDDVNLRVGPGTRYPIDWVYHRRDLPVEIIRELDDWRLVQDQDSVRGWVRAPTLTPRRGFVVRESERTLRSAAADTGSAVARLKPGVIGRVRSCAAGSIWCEVEAATYRGFLKRDEMFGVYPNEPIGG